MRHVRSSTLALLLAVCAALVPATPSAAQDVPAAGALQSTVWRWVHSVVDDNTATVPLDRDRYTIEFGADGSLSVRADCNQASGTYRQLGRRLSLQLGPMTLAACPAPSQGDAFLQQLGAVVSQASTSTVLVLNLRQDSGSMVLEPVPTLALSGTSWLVLSYNNGRGAVTTPILGTELTAEFGTDDVISGSAGCNTYSGGYIVDGAAIAIGPLATTRLACPSSDQAEQEQAFLAALQAATHYELRTDRLTLRNDEGATQVDLLPVQGPAE